MPPRLSVTVNVAVNVPEVAYVRLGFACVDVPPSPNVHAYDAIDAIRIVELLPVNAPATAPAARRVRADHRDRRLIGRVSSLRIWPMPRCRRLSGRSRRSTGP